MKFAKVKNVKSPTRGTNKAAGIDFYIPNDLSPIILGPHEAVKIMSGIKAKVPEGYALIVHNKSGICVNDQVIVGANVIDEDYTGEIGLHVINTSEDIVKFEPGQKIVQMILLQMNYEGLEEVSEAELFLGFESERGEGREGSTGKF